MLKCLFFTDIKLHVILVVKNLDFALSKWYKLSCAYHFMSVHPRLHLYQKLYYDSFSTKDLIEGLYSVVQCTLHTITYCYVLIIWI